MTSKISDSIQRHGSAILLGCIVAYLPLANANTIPAGPRMNAVTQELTRTGLVSDVFQAGLRAYQQGRPREAVRLWRPLAESGYALAQYNLGLVYARGDGVPADIPAAAQWWKKAALQGHTDAQYNLGLVYVQGDGIQRNPGLAVYWWSQAALNGDAAAQYKLGMMYARGDGVEYDLNTAIAWWQRASKQGFPQATELLKALAAKRTHFPLAGAGALTLGRGELR